MVQEGERFFPEAAARPHDKGNELWRPVARVLLQLACRHICIAVTSSTQEAVAVVNHAVNDRSVDDETTTIARMGPSSSWLL